MEEILLLDKPQGITSAKAVARVKRALRVRKAGHAGTLDPLATGLLLIGINEGTKKLAHYLKLPKTYEAGILLGTRTDTGDLEGRVLEEREPPVVEESAVREALAGMVGTLSLPVSPYSALKRGGEPLYKKARRGETVERIVRDMEIRSAELLGPPVSGSYASVLQNTGIRNSVVSVRFDVGSGTYIRSLAEELGKRLGYPATLASLRRTRIGGFDIKDAKSLEEIETQAAKMRHR